MTPSRLKRWLWTTAYTVPIDVSALPFGATLVQLGERYLAPDPVDEVAPKLYVGSARAGRAHAHRFDYCVSVADGLEYDTTTHSFDLDPTTATTTTEFSEAVETVTELWAAGGTVLVHCYEGRERAPTVAAAALAKQYGWDFGTALSQIQTHRPITEPTRELRQLAEDYV